MVFFPKFGVSGLWYNEQKQQLSSQYSSTGIMILNEFMMEEFELVVAEEYKFENRAN